MFTHRTSDYKCPVCLGIRGVESKDTMLKKADLVFKDDLISVFINSFWIPTCEGHVIVVPNTHYENIYDLPENIGHRIFEVAKMMALGMKKAYKCDGITIRQNNEPASGQHAFHYHLHIFPRYNGDSFDDIDIAKKSFASNPRDRISYANKLKKEVIK